MRLVLIGVPGSGKSTIIKRIQGSASVKIADFGTEVLKACSKYGVRTRDEIRKKLTPAQFRSAQEAAASRIAKMKGDVIIDTHATIRSDKGYFPGLPDNVVRKLKPDFIVLLEFDPHDIHERRRSDASRSRDEESPESIDMQQSFNRYFAASAASHSNAYLKVIRFQGKQRRPFEHTERAADEVIKILASNK